MRPPARLVTRALAGLLAGLLATACTGGSEAPDAAAPLLVAGAADLMPAFTELGESFEATTGWPVSFAFGSSGQLAQQIIEGAPMDLYASASTVFVDRVLDAGIGEPDTRTTYAYGRITLWSRPDAWRGWDDLDALVDDGAVGTIAIANPEHAPYGTAAREAFTSAGLWEAVRPRLVLGENIADTQRLAASGNADAAVVALSLALAADGDDDIDGTWVLLDESLHEPLRQELVVITGDADRAEVAARFIEHVNGPDGRAVMRRFGLLLPGEDLPAAAGG